MHIAGLVIPFFAAAALWAQTAASAPPASQQLAPETVVATIDGRKVTVEELRRFVSVLPAQSQKAIAQNRKEFLQQYALLTRLAQEAEKSKLDQQTPYREQLQASRVQTLANAFLNEKFNSFPSAGLRAGEVLQGASRPVRTSQGESLVRRFQRHSASRLSRGEKIAHRSGSQGQD
jgi:hypothetical protein